MRPDGVELCGAPRHCSAFADCSLFAGPPSIGVFLRARAVASSACRSPLRTHSGPRLAVPGKLFRYYNKPFPFRSRIALFHHENRAKNAKKRFLKLLGASGQIGRRLRPVECMVRGALSAAGAQTPAMSVI